MDPRSTKDLLARYRAGEKDALDHLFKRYYERVCAVVHRCLPAAMRPCYETGDVVQEAMLRVLKGVDAFEYRNEGSFFSWICTATERTLIDLVRRSGRKRRSGGRVLSLGPAGDLRPVSPGEGPATRAEEREEYERAMAALDALPLEQRRLILYREYGRLSWQELGDAMGLPLSTARRRCLEALAALAAKLSR